LITVEVAVATCTLLARMAERRRARGGRKSE
jgi:hypothetical protein